MRTSWRPNVIVFQAAKAEAAHSSYMYLCAACKCVKRQETSTTRNHRNLWLVFRYTQVFRSKVLNWILGILEFYMLIIYCLQSVSRPFEILNDNAIVVRTLDPTSMYLVTLATFLQFYLHSKEINFLGGFGRIRGSLFLCRLGIGSGACVRST